MLKLGDAAAHRALGYVSRFLSARGAPAPALAALAAGDGPAASFQPAGAAAALREFDAIVCALASGATPPLLALQSPRSPPPLSPSPKGSPPPPPRSPPVCLAGCACLPTAMWGATAPLPWLRSPRTLQAVPPLLPQWAAP